MIPASWVRRVSAFQGEPYTLRALTSLSQTWPSSSRDSMRRRRAEKLHNQDISYS